MSKGSNSTVTNVQQLPPAVQAALNTAYTDFNPFDKAFDAVGAFDPTATKVGTAGLATGESNAITAANNMLANRPAFLGTAQQNLGGLMGGAVDTTALQNQLGMTADTSLLEGIAGGSTNPFLAAQLENAIGGAVDNVSSQYARGGRLGSGSFAGALGAGITGAAAPILAQNLQQDRANQLNAAQSLLGAQQANLGRDATLANQLTAASEADARARLAAITAAPGLLGADQALISQAAQLGGLSRGVSQAGLDATAAQAAQQNVLDQNQINALLSAAGMGGGLFGQTTTQSGGGPSALSSGVGGAITGATLGNAIGPALAGSGLGSALGVTAANAGGLGAALGAGLSLFSDKRLKKDIKQIGTHANGLAMYSWQWNDEAQSRGFDIYPTEGFMAQEAREVYPQHVHVHPSGYLMLDYASLSNEAMGAA